MNPLNEITSKTIERMKEDAHQKHVIAQAKKICDKIQEFANLKGTNLEMICFVYNEIQEMYPENIKIMNNNGLNVYKSTIACTSNKTILTNYYITWDDTYIDKDFVSKRYKDTNYSVQTFQKCL
jgi:hypothetical protein